MTQVLLQAAANPDAPIASGVAPLLAAVWAGHADVVEVLCRARADPDRASHDGMKPLCLAVAQGYEDMGCVGGPSSGGEIKHGGRPEPVQKSGAGGSKSDLAMFGHFCAHHRGSSSVEVGARARSCRD